MESLEKGKAALISGIQSDAHTEEEKIIADAENQAAEKRQYAQKKVESILNDAGEKAKEQAQAVQRKIISEVDIEIKRRFLRVRDTLMHDIMNRVEKKLNSTIDDPAYRSVLINWITEAVIGLDAESAKINASQKERELINEQLLSEVRDKVQKLLGKPGNLTLSDEPPLPWQGIVLAANEGRVAFNNQVKTRISRKQREIQTLIYNAMFPGDQKV